MNDNLTVHVVDVLVVYKEFDIGGVKHLLLDSSVNVYEDSWVKRIKNDLENGLEKSVEAELNNLVETLNLSNYVPEKEEGSGADASVG